MPTLEPPDLAVLPKVVLHDHLDGGLRPETILELAAEQSYEDLPASDPETLADWFDQGRSGSLEAYLLAFRHTVGVLQTAEALTRSAYEAILDHATAGVVYAELRFGPSLHTRRGLTLGQIVRAVVDGARQGSRETGVDFGIILVAMRNETDSPEIAQLAVDVHGRGVVGFDLAGPERGHPAGRHAAACRTARAGGLGLTLHAGEGDGPESIAGALECGAQRIGHGVRIIEDCSVRGGRIVALGPVARRVHDHRLPLEVCVASNVHTGISSSAASHPIGMLYRAGFNVTVNTDNRLMSRTDMTREYQSLAAHQGFTPNDFAHVTEWAMQAAFCAPELKEQLLSERIRPVYASYV
jgi:adenosine deaminase